MKLAAYHCSLAAPLTIGLLVVGWLVASGVGLGMFWQYKTTGQEPPGSAVNWPEQTELALAADRPTLVMFVHPRCPCTMASVRELTRVLQQSTAQPHVTVVLYQPASAGPEWQSSPVIEAIHALHGAKLVWDREGKLANTFAAATSGQIQLYNPGGRCLFNGGVTRARGHAGESAASQALLRVLQGQEPAFIRVPVYGCEISMLGASLCCRFSV